MNKMILTLLLGIGMMGFSISQCYGPEFYDDVDSNGFWTANEWDTNGDGVFDEADDAPHDCNGNGVWDASGCVVACEAEFKVGGVTLNNDGTYDIDVFFKTTAEMYGYQLDFLSNETGLGFSDNVLTVVPNGDATGSGLIVQGNGGTIVGVSFTGAAVPVTPDWSLLTTLTATEVDANGADTGSSVVLNAHNEGTTSGTTFVVSGAGGAPLSAEWYDTVWTVGSESISLDNDMINPYSYSLKNNYPNPFNPTTTIEYSVAEISDVNISIYDASGRFVKNLVSSQHVPGDDYQVNWNGTNENGTTVAAGMYFYKINAGSFVETKKMLLIK